MHHAAPAHPGKLFVLLVVAGGASAFIGSVLGSAFGTGILFTSAAIGGFIGSVVAVLLAARLRWLEPNAKIGTAIGAAIGFAAAALITVNTLSTPIGALLSPILVGAGGLTGRAYALRK